MSAVSRPGFFKIGVTIACFWESGSRPWRRDPLTIKVTNGSRTSINSRSRNVAIGSNEHDLSGADITILRTSFCKYGRKDANVDVDRGLSVGGSRPSVSERTNSIFRVKNEQKPSAV